MLKFPSISKSVRWVASPTSSMSTARNDFCELLSLLLGGVDSPAK